jgi:hypothetical protein
LAARAPCGAYVLLFELFEGGTAVLKTVSDLSKFDSLLLYVAVKRGGRNSKTFRGFRMG